MPGSNRYSTYQGNFGTQPDNSTTQQSTTVANDDLRSIKNFKQAFRTARQRGLKTFKWGKSVYTTELKKTPSVQVGKLKNEGVVRTPSVQVGPLKNEGVVEENYSQGPSRIMPKQHFADMTNKGFEWDTNKQMWYKPKQPVVEVGAPKPLGILKYRYFQQGGSINMNEQQLQQAFLQFLAQKTGAQSQQELEAAIQQLGEEGLQQAYQEFMSMMQQQQVQAAKFGAKINYIKSLRGVCPEGYEMQYYKQGGTLCKKCIKKQQEMKQGGEIPTDPIDAFKCGGKKKKSKKEEGGSIDFDKCGSKMKKKKVKKENGGLLESFDKATLAKCGAKLKEAACGTKLKKDKCGSKLNKKK